MNENVIYKRPESLTDSRTHYCPGCGHGIMHKVIAEVIDELGVREKTVGIAPVGCAVLAYFYFNFDVVETAHGRAAAVATGLKRSLPGNMVFSYQGDGDLAAIGMAETVHAANRGENISVIFINNSVYGMTGGQLAPTTLCGQRTATSPDGRDAADVGSPIKMCELINTLERPYNIERVMLNGVEGVRSAKKAVRRAFEAQLNEKGYSFVEVLSPCPIYQRLTPLEALNFVENQMQSAFPVGVFRVDGKKVQS